MLRSLDEQIRAILGPDLDAWIVSQLPPGVNMQERGFGDFISATACEVHAFAQRHGVPLGYFWMQGHAPAYKNDRVVVEAEGAGWKSYYTERGEISDLRQFATFEEALMAGVQQLMHDLWIRLNHRQWSAQGMQPPFPPLPEAR